MNIVKMSVATVLALLYLVLAIPLAFLLLLLYVVFGLPTYSLVNSVSSKSKAYKAYEVIIGPLADCFAKIVSELLHEYQESVAYDVAYASYCVEVDD